MCVNIYEYKLVFKVTIFTSFPLEAIVNHVHILKEPCRKMTKISFENGYFFRENTNE